MGASEKLLRFQIWYGILLDWADWSTPSLTR
jgi:hypothetical protein